MTRQWKIAKPEPELVPEPAFSPEPNPVPLSAPARSDPLPPAIQGRPAEVLDMAREEVDPVTLCRGFKIAPVTLRATLGGYANYKRYGGNEGMVGVLRPAQDRPG